MAWQLSETGFIMNLTSYVGDLIKNNIKQMLDNVGIEPSAIDLWAVHPGGKKIVDNFAEALELDTEDLAASYHVLNNYGNMSSPTVLFVLQHLLDQLGEGDRGKKILAAAFGPGLTVETMQLRTHA
jgi:predicted naringenin-chalcone synthase